MKLLRLINCPIPVKIDDRFYDYLNQFRWRLHETRTGKYIVKTENRKNIYLAREIAYILGLDLTNDIDHKDNDIFNNLATNLRAATRSQNIANSKLDKTNSTGYKGVCFHKQNQNYIAYIKVNRKRIHLGSFNNLENAAKAYDTAAREHYGEFARLNFPLKHEQGC